MSPSLSPSLASGLILALGLMHGPVRAQEPQEIRPNILLVLVDDLGADNVKRYGLGTPGDYPVTRTLNHLADTGVRFRNVYANPLCSPTRATILTGRYGFRNTVGALVKVRSSLWPYLPQCETTIPEVLDLASSGYRHAIFGKWHLSNENESSVLHPGLNPERFGPTDAGFGEFAGTMSNLDGQTYYDWLRIRHVRGQPTTTAIPKNESNGPDDRVYATTVCVNDALAFINDPQRSEPWFVYLPLQAVHVPLQVPPEPLRPSDPMLDEDLEAAGYTPGNRYLYADDCGPNPTPACQTSSALRQRRIFKAMVEATDLEIGRLLASLAPGMLDRTTVIVVGDNGSHVLPLAPQLRGGKRSFLEGGVRVPLIVAGAGVTATPGSVVDDLVNTTDLFSTVIELATGMDATTWIPGRTLDSVSLVPYLSGAAPQNPRAFAFAELYHSDSQLLPAMCQLPPVPAGMHRDGYAVREARYKYIHEKPQGAAPETHLLFDLIADPGETNDLLANPTPFLLQVQGRLKGLVDAMKATPDLCQSCP